MTIPIGTISNSNYSLRWRQPYVSESLNRKLNLQARGIVKGFHVQKGGPNSEIVIAPDAFDGVSVAQLLGRSGSNQFALTLRLGSVSLALSGVLAPTDLDKDFAIVIRPEYNVGANTLVGWELVAPADFDDALLNDVMVVGFLRTDALDIANPLQEVFVSGSMASRGVSQGWARQSLMVDYAKMGAPTGDNDGQVLELLYDGGDADFARFREYMAHYGPGGDVTPPLVTYADMMQLDKIDMYALQTASMELFINPVTQNVPDGTLFRFGYLNRVDGPSSPADGHSPTSLRVGGYDATWYGFPAPISGGNPLITHTRMVQSFPCVPGDKFIVQAFIKSGGNDTEYPAMPLDPTIMQGPYQSGLGAFWGGPARQFLPNIAHTKGGGIGSEEIRPLDPDMPATFVHSKNWTLYRETFECPPDYDGLPASFQTPRWFSPLIKFVLQSQGHLLVAGIKVWKVRTARACGSYDEYKLAHTADANPIGEAGRNVALQAGRFSSGIMLNPQSTKVFGSVYPAQDFMDSVPWFITFSDPTTMQEMVASAPNVPAFSTTVPTRQLSTGFQQAVAPAIGVPTHHLRVTSNKRIESLHSDSTFRETTANSPGIWEHVLEGGTVLRAEPSPLTNAMSDVRFCLSRPPSTLVPWSPYDAISPRWCVREDGSVESNAHGIIQQGAQLQASSDLGGKTRLYRTLATDPQMLDLLGQRVATAIVGGDDAALGVGNNAHKGWEGARDEYTVAFFTPWTPGVGLTTEYHIDLCDVPNTMFPGIARVADSANYGLARALTLWTLSAQNPTWGTPGLGFGAATVLELTCDDPYYDSDLADGQSVGFLGKWLNQSASGLPWPSVSGGLVLRRGQTTETVGPTGYRGDSVASIYTSKAGLPLTHFAVDPWGCSFFRSFGSLDALPAVPAFPNALARPGGDNVIIPFSWTGPASMCAANMPEGDGFNLRWDPISGAICYDTTTFTEHHWYTPSAQNFGVPEVGDAMDLFSDGTVGLATTAQSAAVVGIWTGYKQATQRQQNSLTGESVGPVWYSGQTPVDWERFAYDPDNPPVEVEPDPGDVPELVKVASVGDNRTFEPNGTPILSGFNVVDEQLGNIAVGDLLEMSQTPGKLRRQADGIVRNTTVGKALQAVSFSDGAPSPSYGIYGILMCG